MSQPSKVLWTAAGPGLILAATLWPSPGESLRQPFSWCLLCGSRDTADTLLNFLLFVPFGSGLALLGGPTLAVAGSLGLSAMVEVIQTTLPGRQPSLGDILANTGGGAAGALLVALRTHIAGWMLYPTGWVKLASGLLAPAVFAVTAALSAPSFPETLYYGQWTHEIGNLQPYPGQVVAATVGELSLPDGPAPKQEAVREAFRSGEPLLVVALSGPEPPELSHLFAVYDHRRREVLLVAVQGSDVVLRQLTRSDAIRLDQPFVRWRGALDVQESDTLRIMARPEARGLCLEVGSRERCDLVAGMGGGWRLLHRLSGAPAPLVTLLSIAWLAILAFPAGTALGNRGQGIPVGIVLGILAVTVSWWSPWLSPHLVDLLAPILGAGGGWAFRTRLARKIATVAMRKPPEPGSPPNGAIDVVGSTRYRV